MEKGQAEFDLNGTLIRVSCTQNNGDIPHLNQDFGKNIVRMLEDASRLIGQDTFERLIGKN